MVNIQNIFDSEILIDPWEHQIVEDFLTEESFDIICQGGKILASNALHEARDPNGIWLFDAKRYGVSQEIIDHIMSINLCLLKKNSDVLKRYSNPMRSKIGYFSVPRYNFIGSNVNSTIHDEGPNKTMAMVVYLTPEKTFGTKLYKSENPTSFVKEVEWKPNRAFLMCSQPGVTWHSFHSNDQPRMTINFYYEKMENMSYINSLGDDKMKWFYDQFENDNLYVNL